MEHVFEHPHVGGVTGGIDRGQGDADLLRPGEVDHLGRHDRVHPALGGDHHRLVAHDDVPGQGLLAPEPLLFLVGAGPTGEDPPEQRRGGHRRGQGHEHHHGVRRLVEHAEGQAHRRDHDLERTAGVQPDAERRALSTGQAGDAGRDHRPGELGQAGGEQHDARPQQHLGVAEQAQVDAQPGGGEEDRRQERGGHGLDRLDGAVVAQAAAPEQHAGHERAEHGLHAEPLRDGAGAEGEEQHQPGGGVDRRTCDPQTGEAPVEGPLPDGEGQAEEDHEAGQRGEDGADLDGAGLREAGHDAEQHPADHVVGHAGRQGELAEVAPHEPHLAEDLGDHRERRDRQGCSQEQGEDGAVAGLAEEEIGHDQPDDESEAHRHHEAAGGDDAGGTTEAADQGQVGLVAGDHEQAHDAEPRDREQHGGLHVVLGEQPVEDVGGRPPQHRGAEDDAGRQLADHRRLAHLAGQQAEQPGQRHHGDEADPEDEQLVLTRRVQVHARPPRRSGGSGQGTGRSAAPEVGVPGADAPGCATVILGRHQPCRHPDDPARPDSGVALIATLALHLAVGATILLAAPVLRRWAAPLAALPPIAGLAFAASIAPDVIDGTPWRASFSWVSGLDLSVDLFVDGLGLVMILLVSGIGLAIAVYSGSYFAPNATAARTAGLLVLFAGAMLGLVTAEHVVVLYLFWELTSIRRGCSSASGTPTRRRAPPPRMPSSSPAPVGWPCSAVS